MSTTDRLAMWWHWRRAVRIDAGYLDCKHGRAVVQVTFPVVIR